MNFSELQQLFNECGAGIIRLNETHSINVYTNRREGNLEINCRAVAHLSYIDDSVEIFLRKDNSSIELEDEPHKTFALTSDIFLLIDIVPPHFLTSLAKYTPHSQEQDRRQSLWDKIFRKQ